MDDDSYVDAVLADTKEKMNRAIAHASMRPVIDSVFGFDEVRAAFEHFSTGTRMGKVVIRID